MFSSEQALTRSIRDLRAWILHLRCGRCRREVAVELERFVPPDTVKRTLGDVLRRVRCRKCGARPDHAMITARGGAGQRAGCYNMDKKGGVQVMLWARR
jgi:hypothetical protein